MNSQELMYAYSTLTVTSLKSWELGRKRVTIYIVYSISLFICVQFAHGRIWMYMLYLCMKKKKHKHNKRQGFKYSPIILPSSGLLRSVTPSGKNSHSKILIHHCLARFISASILRRYLKVTFFFPPDINSAICNKPFLYNGVCEGSKQVHSNSLAMQWKVGRREISYAIWKIGSPCTSQSN